MTIKPLILCKPRPAGTPQYDRHFFYRNEIADVVEIPSSEVPFIDGIDDGGNQYQIRVENGWLLDFITLGGETKKWAIFARDGDLFLDRGNGPEAWSLLAVSVSVDLYYFAARVKLAFATHQPPHSIWVRFPWARTLFLDGQSRVVECEPICDILSELSTTQGVELWKRRWLSGFSVRNEFIKPASAARTESTKN